MTAYHFFQLFYKLPTVFRYCLFVCLLLLVFLSINLFLHSIWEVITGYLVKLKIFSLGFKVINKMAQLPIDSLTFPHFHTQSDAAVKMHHFGISDTQRAVWSQALTHVFPLHGLPFLVHYLKEDFQVRTDAFSLLTTIDFCSRLSLHLFSIHLIIIRQNLWSLQGISSSKSSFLCSVVQEGEQTHQWLARLEVASSGSRQYGNDALVYF